MSAVLEDRLRLVPMREDALDDVLAIEDAVYSHPWTRLNFADSLRSGYECWTWRDAHELIGYFVLAAGAGEAHLLNLSVAASAQRRGHGSALLREALRIARARAVRELFLEVRPSNAAARALYARFGFRLIGSRRDYYPARAGREDALVFAIAL
jgi:ribosomal-protein-alanine N-acetyltransferase